MTALAFAPLIVSMRTQFLRPKVNGLIARSAAYPNMWISSENSIRPVIVVRKNRLFSDSQDGAEASMLCYTIIRMAKFYNIKIYDYIMSLLSERPSMDMNDEELDKLPSWSEGIQERIQTFIDSKES